jgi:hypothetical protein
VRSALLMGTPGSAAATPCGTQRGAGGGGDDDDLGFFLHTSQTYTRHSQPAISPNVAAGLATAQEGGEQGGEQGGAAQQQQQQQQVEEPFTTPSQDSRVRVLLLQAVAACRCDGEQGQGSQQATSSMCLRVAHVCCCCCCCGACCVASPIPSTACRSRA